MQSFKLTLDRIENDIAVLLVREKEKKCETVKIDMPLFLLPPGTKEGDILEIAITIDTKETEDAKERVSALLEKLKNKNKRLDKDQKMDKE
ncbi:MAG TPA: DUF3006 domain-containing protein [Methanosarcina sp.]|jgi:hypothetical protein|nr:DUF3006 domain-containing protein [Methanosarcina sp.]